MGFRFRAILLVVVCAVAPVRADDETGDGLPQTAIVVSVAEQKLALLKDGGLAKRYPISTSKFGLGDSFNSYKTPLGKLRVCDKIGNHLAMGAVLKGRNPTGEILPVNAPGRDPIVTRILWLEGLESQNANARSRGIYIHGTVEEEKLGQPVSYGCIRMRSRDVVELFDEVPVGTPVLILSERFPRFQKAVPKPEILVASNDGVTMKTVGPHGQVIVRSRRVLFASDEKSEVAAAAKAPVVAPRTSEVPKLAAAKTRLTPKVTVPARPEPASEPEFLEAEVGPRVVFTQFPAAPQKAAPAPEPTIVFKLKESVLTAGLEKAPASATPERKPSPGPVETIPAPAAPQWVVLAIAAPIDFLGNPTERPLDLLSAALLEVEEGDSRIAFRTASLPTKL